MVTMPSRAAGLLRSSTTSTTRSRGKRAENRCAAAALAISAVDGNDELDGLHGSVPCPLDWLGVRYTIPRRWRMAVPGLSQSSGTRRAIMYFHRIRRAAAGEMAFFDRFASFSRS
jgi:hypothetical protein